jgi:RNA polymerase sigma-70 factor (ECF subfamily)
MHPEVALTAPQEESIDGFRREDPRALERLAARYAPRLYRWAYARLRHAADAQDVVQETFVRAMRGLATFDGRCAVSTWLYTIAHNLIRSGRRRKEVEQRALEKRGAAAAAGHDGIDAALDLLDRLDEDLRPVLLLYYVEGLALAEIATVLELPETTVKWRLFEGRRELRRFGRNP